MVTRRRFLGYSALTPVMMAYRPLLGSSGAQTPRDPSRPVVRLAVLGNTYRLGSSLQTITDRFLVGYPFEGDWHMPQVKVVSMYLDTRPVEMGPAYGPGRIAPSPVERDVLADGRAKEFGFRLCRNIPDALRCGGDNIAVDAVLVVLEQGDYARNHHGQILYPRYDYFQQCARVFEDEGKAVPYFNHESLSFSFQQAKSMVATAERLNFPLMAGSSMPVTWRIPDADIPLGAKVEDAVMVGVGSIDGTDFDALEAMQSMMERRKGGETGVKSVQFLEGDDVWAAGEAGGWSKELLSSAQSRSDALQGLTIMDGRPQNMVASGVLPELVRDPSAYCIDYVDGTRATLLLLNGADADFTFAARVAGHGKIATQFFNSPTPNVTYSASLASKIEEMYITKKAPYSVRRTLLTGGILESCLNSRARQNQKIETPHLMAVHYQPPTQSQYART